MMRSFVILALLFLSSALLAQESCVFLSPHKQGATSRRPKGLIRQRPQQPQQQLPPSIFGEYPNINISEAFAADQNETSVAISPTDPNRILVGANDYRSFNALWKFLSTDGGLNWAAASLNPATNLAVATDPAVAFNTNGDAFYTYGRIDNGGSPYPRNDIAAYRSTDGGNNFGDPFIVTSDTSQPNNAQVLADKYYLAIDKSATSTFKNRIYVTWAEYSAGLSSIMMSYSSDNGMSWSAKKDVAGQSEFQAPIPATGPGGDLYITYLNLHQFDTNIYFAHSTDGGKTIAKREVVGKYSNLGRPYPPSSANPHPIIKGHLRVNSFPSIAIDNSSKHLGRIYIVWASMGPDAKHHILLSSSDDKGNSWSVPKQIEGDNSSSATDKFFPWVAVDDRTGDVGVVFYDSRMDAATNQLTDAFMAHSNDGGVTFAVARISDVSFNPSVAGSTDSLAGGDTLSFFGDYNGIVGNDSVWYPVWTDSRSGYDQDIYTAIVRPYAPSVIKNFIVTENESNLPILSWGYDAKTAFGRELTDYHFLLTRSDGGLNKVLGKDIRQYIDPTVTPNITYTYILQVVSGDTSLRRIVTFSPKASITSLPPDIHSSSALADGFSVTFRMPSKSEAGTEIKGLHKIYFFIDGILFDSINTNDAQKGLEFEKFFAKAPGTFSRFEATCRIRTESGQLIDSKPSTPVSLYAGNPLESYSESFQDSKTTFTPFAWDTTSYNGQLASRYMNDSLPGVNYHSGVDSWFTLPPVTIGDGTKTLEFDHIALVAVSDSAIVEVSSDNGVHFSELRYYNKTYSPNWTNSILTSSPRGETVSMKHLMGRSVTSRFRLKTSSSSEDGWFLKNIKYSDALSVRGVAPSSMHIESRPNPLRIQSTSEVTLTVGQAGKVSLSVYDMLGRKVKSLMNSRFVEEGEYSYRFTIEQTGSYYLLLETPEGKASTKCIVLP
ncbi:MAG TPA: T9SS type A sorting domain-containing protein [Candidatus Kapabacteria bacterium]